MGKRFLICFWVGFGIAVLGLLGAIMYTAANSWLFAGCLVLFISVFVVVALWGSQSERL